MTGTAPADWTVLPLARLAHIERGRFSARPRNDPKYYGGRYPFIQTGDVRNSRGKIESYSQTLNEEGLKVSKLFPAGTLFLTIAANIGDLGVSQFACSCPDSLVAVRPNNGTHQGWLLYALSAQKQTLESIATHNAQANLNLAKLNPFPLLVPPYRNQSAIAEALGDVDELIAALERMVTKKEAIKQGVMQQLLTGKTRLHGFTDRWSQRRIGDFAEVRAGGTPATAVDRYWGGDVPWMSSGEIHQKQIWGVRGRITKVGLQESSAHLLPPQTVLMALAGQGKTRGTVAISRIQLATNQSVAGIYPSSEHDSDYLYFNLDSRYAELRGESAGDGGRGGLNLTIIKRLVVPFPSLEEQHAIANVLLDVEEELRVLAVRLVKAHTVKHGMMQQLLTGRTRLPVKESAA
ncbi:type I restriction enzyme, S subunit [Frankia sp. Hr75.2]|nr:type I restriction enzyme, S subunit [Frankia sp. Hr75.2]